MALDLDSEARGQRLDAGLLAAVADALASADLDEALGRFAEVARESTGAARCTVLLTEGRRLRLVPAAGDTKGKARPVALDVLLQPAGVADVLRRSAPTVVDDAAGSPTVQALMPSAVAPEATAVVLVPMRVDGQGIGLLAASWDAGAPSQAAKAASGVLVAIGRIAAATVRQADAFEAARRWAHAQDVLAAAAAVLAAPLTPGLVTRQLAESYGELLDPRLCLVGVLDETRDSMVSISGRGSRRVRGSVPLDEIPHHVVRRLCRTWTESPEPVDVPDERWLADVVGGRQAGVGWYQLVPLTMNARPAGAAVLGFHDSRRLDADEQEWVLSLAELGDAALERHAARERHTQRAQELEFVARVAASFVDAPDGPSLLVRLRELLAERGVELLGVTYRDQRLARRLGGDEPTPEDEEAWRSRAPVSLPDGGLAVPLRLGQRPVGTMRIRPAELTGAQRSIVEALAGTLADLSSRRAMRLALEEAERERALKEERDRLAVDLHDTAGQLFVAISLLAQREDEEAADGRRAARIAELAERGRWEIAQAVRALAFVPSTRHGVVPAVRGLARSLSEDSGIEVLVEVTGRPVRLAPRAERALYRVAHEALTNAWRHARCAVVRVEIAFAASEVVVRVVDDGLGLGLRQQADGSHLGLTGMRRALADVDGALRVRNARPRGVSIEARVARSAGGG